MKDPTLEKLAQEALDIQDACNLSGLAIRFAKVCVELRDITPLDTPSFAKHPIVILWIDKMWDLIGRPDLGGDSSAVSYTRAYNWCEEHAARGRKGDAA